MRKRLPAAIAALAGLVLAGGAVPALSDGNGTVHVSITAESPAAPCLEITNADVNFGTHAFSAGGAYSVAQGDVVPRFRDCGTAFEDITIQGTDATGPAVTWALTAVDPAAPDVPFSCSNASRNEFSLRYILNGNGAGSRWLLTAARSLTSAGPGQQDQTLALNLIMPCNGSDGGGATLNASITLTAAVA
jgi:hypothetical protein